MTSLFAWILDGLWWLVSLLPLKVHYVISDLLYVLIAKVVRYRRKVVHRNLVKSFPDKSHKEIRQIEKGFYHWFCDYIVETVKMKTISPDEIRRRMVFKGYEAVNRELEAGRSVCLYLGHYCNWEWVTTLPFWLSDKAVRGEIYHPLENKVMDRLFLRVRQRFGTVCIPQEETIRKIVKFNQAGRPVVIGFIADQKPNWHNIHLWLPFLNHPDTPVLTGTERIARKRNQAIFYVDMQRPRRGYYEGEFVPMTFEPKALEEHEITKRYFQMLEKSIRRQPEFWLWSHDRWKRTREEFDERFVDINGKIIEKKYLKKPQEAVDSASSASCTAE